ncbi:MAG: T9SS type A sorting domain-containing protein [Ignavibacteriaceae bacterium]|nr:T9SS type A sorting domain-containing protein [Ignavibacteriaceae bacterium]
MKYSILFILLLAVSVVTYGQLYQGPAAGSVASGVSVSTFTFESFGGGDPTYNPKPMRNLFINTYIADNKEMPAPSAPEGANYFIDPMLTRNPVVQQGDFILNKNFQGIPDQGIAIPPDPYIAAGPTHLLAVVNSRFRILDKNGQVINTIEASNWYSSVLPGCDPFDPKVIYDQHAKRWVMVWLHLGSSTAYFLVSVSDDSIPTGTWYNYAMPSHVNGSTPSNNWSDYQGVGYDKDAIYITGNQFQFSGTFDYCKLRVIPKTALYANNGGPVAWNDLWDIKTATGIRVFGLRPSRIYGQPAQFYLVARSPYVTGTFFTLYKLTNPLTTPAMTAVDVPVTQYSDPNDAGQQGGSQTIDGGASNIRNEPVFRNGKLYMVHAVKSGTGGAFSSVRYVAFDVATNTAVQDQAMGADGYFHFYPAMEVDPADNLAFTYTRSAATEYAGAYYTTKPNDATNMTGSKVLKTGAGYYYKTFGGSRNRWGDYNGIWLDPSTSNIWLFTEYVAATNTWGTWVGELVYSTSAALVGVIAPNGGEVWQVGSTQTISWSSSNVTNVKIEYSTNNGSAWTTVAASVAAAGGTYSWVIPSTPTNQALVRVSDASNANVFDVSNATFTIGSGPAEGWIAVQSGTTGDIWGIDWASPTVVWLCASNGDVKRSTDAGTTWQAAGNAGQGAYTIAALSENVAVVSLGPDAGDGKLMRTTNGGTSWSQVYTTAGAWFNFVDNIDATNLWAQSDPIGGVFHIVKSTDAGATWSLASNLPSQPSSTVFGANSSYYRIDNTFWFGTGGSATTNANRVYRSVNGINGPWTFATTTQPYAGGVAFSSATGNGLASFWQASNTLNKSVDGGTTFTSVTASLLGLTHGVEFIRGTAVAFAGTANGLFRSTNNGDTWTAENIPTGAFNLNVIRFYNDADLGLTGGNGGLLLKSNLQRVIPVELTSFTASVGEYQVTLNWNTATEVNNRGFEVQRMIDGNSWITIGFVEGRGTTSDPVAYSYSDKYNDFNYSGNVSYRLRQVDFDGRSELSSVINLDINFSVREYALNQNYPNPFNPSTLIKYALPKAGKVTIKVYNSIGKEVATLVDGLMEAGNHEVTFDAGALASGVYFYKMTAGEFSQSRKLLLMK